MIEYLASGDRTRFAEMASYDLAYVEHLIGYGLVVRRGDDFEFAFEAVEDGVKRSLASTSTKLPALAEKWETIGKRRNHVETEIRRALYQWAMRLSGDDWNSAFRSCVAQKRLSETGQLTRQESFALHNSRLYFIELMKFIEYSGLYQSAGTGLSDISKAMQLVNAHRIDAHAKSISDDEFNDVTAALNLLEEIFIPPL